MDINLLRPISYGVGTVAGLALGGRNLINHNSRPEVANGRITRGENITRLLLSIGLGSAGNFGAYNLFNDVGADSPVEFVRDFAAGLITGQALINMGYSLSPNIRARMILISLNRMYPNQTAPTDDVNQTRI